ncbi:hypothetical protein V8C42DRAFT_322287 [Trichoderma barbatum]
MQDRLCFSIGDFLSIRQTGSSPKMARLLGVFTHARHTARYMFAVVDFAVARTDGLTREPILECPIFDLASTQAIVRLSDIKSKRL